MNAESAREEPTPMVTTTLRTQKVSSRGTLDDLVWLLEQTLLEGDLPIDRTAIRRVLQEAADGAPGPMSEMWSIWLTDAASSLGLRCRRVEGAVEDLAELAECGAPFITWLPGSGAFGASTASRGRRVKFATTSPERKSAWLKIRQMRQMIASDQTSAVIHSVVFEGRSTAVFQEMDHHEDSPWKRLRQLLQPEASDIRVVLIFAVVNGFLALATPIAVEALVNTVALGQLVQPLIVMSFCVFVLLSFSAGLKAVQTVVVETIQKRLFARVAGDLAYRLPRVSPVAAGHYYLPELVNRFFEVVTVQKVSAQLLLDGVSLVIGTLVGMLVLAFYHPWLLGIDVLLLLLMGFAVVVLGRGAVSTSIKESKKKYAMAAWLEDLAGCDQAFRYASAADFALDRADQLTYEYLDGRTQHFRVLMRQVVFTLFLQAFASTVLLGVGGWLVMQGQLTLGQLVAAELIVAVIVGSFAKLGKHIESYYDLLASVDKLGVLFDLPIHRQDGLISFPASGPALVELRNVAYEGEGGRLSPVTCRIAPGDRLALTGPSGSGKSTLVALTCGRFEPTSGQITIDGIAPHDLRPDVLQRHVALVSAEEVFSGTILENVHLGRPEVSLHDVRQALQVVGLLPAVLELPEGLESHVTRSGRPLTRLQQKRLTLARAIAAQPRLLIVDGLLDPFPDQEAESLAAELGARRHPWTLILVTGRGVLAAGCDQILDLGSAAQLSTNGDG